MKSTQLSRKSLSAIYAFPVPRGSNWCSQWSWQWLTMSDGYLTPKDIYRQNSLARIVCVTPYRSSATRLRRSLHWLPIRHQNAYLTVRACRRWLCAFEEIALFRRNPAGHVENEKHHRVKGFQRRDTQNLEQFTTRHQVFHLHLDLPAAAQDTLVRQRLLLAGFPTASQSQCLEERPSPGKALI